MIATNERSVTIKKEPEVRRQRINDIQWQMIDKKRYFPLTVVNMFTIRTVLYPLTLVRTRLQVQTRGSLYTGTFNALKTVIKYEGFLALYKGFVINSFQLIPHVFYITSYEKTRQLFSNFTSNRYLTAFVGGASGSVFAQMLSVPIDIISQHMMLVGQKSGTCSHKTSKFKDLDRINVPERLRNSSNFVIARYISNEIYRNEKFRGFYRGYILSTSLVSMNSALWWPFYYFYQAHIGPYMPEKMPVLLIQCICGPLSSLSANTLTNPLDCMRARMQVNKKRESSLQVLKNLWKEDGYRLFYRGLTARLSYSCLYSILITLGYETTKKHSLKEEYQEILYPIE